MDLRQPGGRFIYAQSRRRQGETDTLDRARPVGLSQHITPIAYWVDPYDVITRGQSSQYLVTRHPWNIKCFRDQRQDSDVRKMRSRHAI